MGSEGDRPVDRLIEQYDTLVELDVAGYLRELDGWALLSAGSIRPGRWWAEYERQAPGSGGG
jgi:hypothetical protein